MTGRRPLAALASVLLLSACSVFGGSSVESPDHRVIASDGDFEIREYPPLTLAVTEARGDWDEASDQAFRRLFDYISGSNRGGEKIDMTAPVLAEAETGQEIAMTAPVLTEPGADGWRMAFVLPGRFTPDTAPEPVSDRVRIEAQPARRLGAVTFSGRLGAEAFARQRARLAEWLSARGAEPAGDWQLAGYDPPWTLPPFRRNEVLVELR